MKLQLQTPEQQAGRAKIGMAVAARVAAFPDRDFMGKVTAINPSVDPNSRVFILEAKFDNPKGDLRPGMFSTARVMLPGGEQAIFVPRNAVIRDKTTDSFQVFTIDGNTAHLRVVLTGETDGDQTRILTGLNPNDTVATSRQGELYDGATVKVK
jgi:membrane fusion protein (multidrug efflux system)